MEISYKPHNASYSVTLEVDCNFFNPTVNKITYDIDIIHLKKDGDYNIIEVSKSYPVLNNQPVNLAYNDILLTASEAINKIVFKVDKTGMAVDFLNYKEILNKWVHARQKVEMVYLGDPVLKFLDEMEENLISPARTWAALKKDYFVSTFFSGIYKNFGESKTTYDIITIYDLLPTESLSGKVQQTLLPKSQETATVDLLSVEKFDRFLPETEEYFDHDSKQGRPMNIGIFDLDGTVNVNIDNGKILKASILSSINIENTYSKRLNIDIRLK